MDPCECVATKITSAACISFIHVVFAKRLLYNLQVIKFSINRKKNRTKNYHSLVNPLVNRTLAL